MTVQEDKAEILDLIVRERLARDVRRWDEMRSCWAEDSHIEVSWFEGGSDRFIEQTKQLFRPDSLNFHQLCPGSATVEGDRAIVEMPCVLHEFTALDGIEVNQVGHSNLLWRATRAGGRWLLAGLRAYYLRDSLIPCDPTRPPKLDAARLGRYRPSYRYLCYLLEEIGGTVRHDLPGIDKPETVEALQAGERKWLANNEC